MNFRYLMVLLCWLFSFSSLAQDNAYPSMDALSNLTLPPNNPIDLAQRLRGVDIRFIPPSQAPDWQVGDTKLFNVVYSAIQSEAPVNAVLRGISENVLLWIGESAPVSDAMAQQFVELVDTTIYQQVQDLWGIEEPPGVDGDPRLYILMAEGLDSAIAGYFADVHTYPRSIVPNSNQHEMMIFNLSVLSNYDILNPQVLTIIAHEYQHVLRHFRDSNEATWLDEGFSTYTEHYIGWDAGRSQVVNFLMNPNVQLNQWVADVRRFPRYGAVFLFVNYFAGRFGLDALRQLSDEPLDGWQGVDTVLQQIAGLSADEFFADWVLANYFLDIETGYGYETLWRELPSARPISSIVTYPYRMTGRLAQYSTDYHTAVNFADASTLTLTISQPDHAQFIPTVAFDGDYFYYSVPADSSDVMLTRRIDLSGVDMATMTFRTWYDLEEFWDYGYVLASADNGITWDILSGTTTRTNNPYNRAYGAGYTGMSFGWVEETIPLDDYAGQEILIRFEVITDAASIRHGMAIDELRISEINYVDSFESSSDSWTEQGWIRTDNRLPQRAWLQVVQQVGKDLTLARWLVDADSTFTVDLVHHVEQVLIAVSPIAPQTMLETTYTLEVDVR